MPKPRATRRHELLDMGARALAEFQEAERRREQWAQKAALKEQIEQLIRQTGSKKEER